MVEKDTQLNEVILGVSFDPPIETLRAENIGIYWSKIRDKFPQSTQRDLFGGNHIQLADEIFPLPRFWFVSADDQFVIQIQRSSFIFNWRKRQFPYPRYEAMKEEFKFRLSEFVDFITHETNRKAPEIDHIELTYVNVFNSSHGYKGNPEQLVKNFKRTVINNGQCEPIQFSLENVYNIDSGVQLKTNFKSVKKRDTGEPALHFEISAGADVAEMNFSNVADIIVEFDRCHDVINDTFEELTK